MDYNEVDVDMVEEPRDARVKRLSVNWKKEESESRSGAPRYSEQEEWDREMEDE